MPIVRFSCLGTKLYAPTRDGNLVKQDFAGEAGLLHDISFAQLAAADGPVDRYLAARLPGAAARNPIVIMVNGWGFDPEQPVGAAAAAALASENPHGRIFHWWAHAADQAHDAHAASWPLGLGFAREDDGPGGAAIAFGWDSSDESHAAAYDDGNNAAAALVAVIERMAAADAQLHVNFIGHSLGTHVLCHTLRILATQFQELLPYVGRVVLMGASEYAFEADATYDALRKAEAAEPQSCAGLQIYNIANTSDRVTRLAGGLATHGPRGSLHMVCHHGLKSPDPAPRWIDIDLNSAALANRINELFQCVVSGNRPDDFLDHWYYFTHAPNMAFAQALLRGRAGTSIEALKAAGVQTAFGR